MGHGTVKLTPAHAAQILARRRTTTRPALAASFGVSRSTIDRIIAGTYNGWWVPERPIGDIVERDRVKGSYFLTVKEVAGIRRMRQEGFTLTQVAVKYGIDRSTVSRVARGELHKPTEGEK